MYRFVLQTTLVLFVAFPALAQWTPAMRISEQSTSFGPRIAANGDMLHVIYWTNPLGTNRVFYLRSENAGGTWSNPFLLPDTLQMFNFINPIIKADGNRVIGIWRGDFIGSQDMNFGLRLTTDAGITWNDVIMVLADNRESLQQHTLSIGGGIIYIVYSRWAGEIIVEFTKSTDWGQSWSIPTEIFRTLQTGQFDMVARGDTLHVVWTGRFTDEYPIWETYYLKSDDGGENWSENISLGTVDDRGSMYPSIAINERGDLVACWVDFKYSPYWWTGDLFVRYSYDAGQSWTDEEQIIFTHTAESSRILWQGDSLHITWEDTRNGGADPYYMASHDNGLTWGDEQRIDDNEYNSHTPDIAVTGQKIHVVWDDRRQVDQGRGIYYSRWDEEVGIEEDNNMLPSAIVLTAYPNPFNGNATIAYNLLEGGEIEIYSITGQKIRTLNIPTKEGKTMWDARDALGNKVCSGIYFARAKTHQNSSTIKLIYLK